MLGRLPKDAPNPDVLIGLSNPDDAGVYRLDDRMALVQTVDFFPPIVDDPYDFGAICAANAISDVYAMGGRPITALNLTAFPEEYLDKGILEDILKGGHDKAAEAGVAVIGGHSIHDKEIKYGMAVTGLVEIARMVTKGGACPGDLLYLTKPLGVGIIASGAKRGLAPEKAIKKAVRSMKELNRGASEAMVAAGVRSGTDVTGFGLLGHLSEMLTAGGVGAELSASAVPVFDEVWDLALAGIFPGRVKSNLEFLENRLIFSGNVTLETRHILCDPQTSGGLLIAVPEQARETFLREAEARKASVVAEIGRIVEDTQCRIRIRP